MKDKRIIIGECQNAGWPLSAPVATKEQAEAGPRRARMRFVAHNDKHCFTLEYYNPYCGCWEEVPVVNSIEPNLTNEH